MFLPILHSEDGYGFTYGARISFVDRLGPRSRITVPLTWGGERAGARAGGAGVQGRARSSASPANSASRRRENPHYEIGDRRVGFGARARIGAGAVAAPWRRRARATMWSLATSRTRCRAFGGDVTIDTRVDPAFPRNAVHATFGIDRLQFDAGDANQKKADVRGYVGLFGQTVLAVRGLEHHVQSRVAALRAQPARRRRQPARLRRRLQGRRQPRRASAELRIPITSPLSIGRFGVKAFVDCGRGLRRRREARGPGLRDRGIGGGAYLHLTARQPVARRRPIAQRRHPLPLRHGSDLQITNNKEHNEAEGAVFRCSLFVIRYSSAMSRLTALRLAVAATLVTVFTGGAIIASQKSAATMAKAATQISRQPVARSEGQGRVPVRERGAPALAFHSRTKCSRARA